jgi:exodeoxyribonuclease V alpha subunit
VVRLDQIFRQEKESLIVLNAHKVNRGEKLVFPEKGDRDSDFYFMYKPDEQEAFNLVLGLCSGRIPQKLGLHPLSPQIQVISPMYRGLVGVDNLNRELQKTLNPLNDGMQIGNREFRLRDKIMQLRNNYDKDVFNGDIGTVKDFDRKAYKEDAWNGEVIENPAEPVSQVVDTTGAGDLFAAGFLHGFVDGRNARDCAVLGAVAAAEVISHFGARPEADLAQLARKRLGV